jgi:hypothetical protein
MLGIEVHPAEAQSAVDRIVACVYPQGHYTVLPIVRRRGPKGTEGTARLLAEVPSPDSRPELCVFY